MGSTLVTGLRLVLALALAFTPMASPAEAKSICEDCRILLGVGGTFDFSGSTHGLVLPVTFTWSENRYELGVFRIATAQDFSIRDAHARRRGADPYWGFSVSRRWELVRRPTWHFFIGVGASYKPDSDELTATHCNFAEQLGIQIGHQTTGGAVELSIRHWSNAGIKLPNRGVNFIMVSYEF